MGRETSRPFFLVFHLGLNAFSICLRAFLSRWTSQPQNVTSGASLIKKSPLHLTPSKVKTTEECMLSHSFLHFSLHDFFFFLTLYSAISSLELLTDENVTRPSTAPLLYEFKARSFPVFSARYMPFPSFASLTEIGPVVGADAPLSEKR